MAQYISSITWYITLCGSVYQQYNLVHHPCKYFISIHTPHSPSSLYTHTHTHSHTGDEILDINGTTITGLQVSEVAEVIRSSPEEFLATVKPITAVRKGQKAETSKVTYSELLPQEPLQTNHDNVTANGSTVRPSKFLLHFSAGCK